MVQLNRYSEQLGINLDSLAAGSTDAAVLSQISALYVQVGDYRRALSYAQRVYALLPSDQQSAYYPTIQQLQSRLNQ